MEDVFMFVDDGFFGLVKNHFQNKSGSSKKYLQTFRNICKKEGLNLKHVFIYTAPPFQSSKPNLHEKSLMSQYEKMTKMFRKKKWISLREGRCDRHFNSDKKAVYQQKGVDSLLIIDMFECFMKSPEVKNFILIASDSDFVPVIKNMKEKEREVVLYTYFDRIRKSRFSTSNHLLQTASRWEKLKMEDFE